MNVVADKDVSASNLERLQYALSSLESVVGNIQNAFNALQQSQKAYIVEEWRSGRNWYRKWSSGFIEQGGMVYDVHWGTTSNFHTPFTTTDITIIGQSDGNIGADWNYVNGIGVRIDSPSTFTLSSGHNGRFNIHWIAYGY